MSDSSFSRREFLIGATAATAAMLLPVQEILAQATTTPAPAGPPVVCGVIGAGQRGREILTSVSKFPNASIAAICDSYDAAFTRAKESAPNAATLTDYKELLGKKEIEAVFIATPSHLHKDIALAALQAGKHVYLEAPMASSVDDSKAIHDAAVAASAQVFHVGQQLRSNPLRKQVLKFMGAGAVGNPAVARGQWHKKDSWKRTAASPDREKALNWRLSSQTSAGLIGEIGLHQIDCISWYLGKLPISVSGCGGILQWKDERDVADTAQFVFEYPNDIRVIYDATLVSSFDGNYEVIQGSDSSIYLQGQRAWMVREADSPVLGWEVYARIEPVSMEKRGIAMVADASKLLQEGKEPGKEGLTDLGKDELHFAVEDFLGNVRKKGKPSCGAKEGHNAAVVAIKANEALTTGTKITYQKEWFDLT